jgi:hypothetical protein
VNPKSLVLWGSDLGLRHSAFGPDPLYTKVHLYRKVSYRTQRNFVLCLDSEKQISNMISSLFDQIFLIEGTRVTCLKNRFGGHDLGFPHPLWRHRGMVNRLRLAYLFVSFIASKDRENKLKG